MPVEDIVNRQDATILVAVPEAIYMPLQRAAKESGRSWIAELREAIAYWVKRDD